MERRRTVDGAVAGLRYAVTEERFESDRWRTASIEGPIRLHDAPRPPVTGVDERSAFDHRGHLIAHRLGGPSGEESGNLVAMHGRINMSGTPWYQMEATIARFLASGPGRMRVDVQYASRADLRPHAFRVEVHYANGMRSTWRTHNFNPMIRPSNA